MTVEQFEARSADGTMIPYFVVHKADMPLDGSNPTLLYGYGGFQVSQLPGYSATVGKLWLERGGVYVVANMRGGGEFGPRLARGGPAAEPPAGPRGLPGRGPGPDRRATSPPSPTWASWAARRAACSWGRC